MNRCGVIKIKNKNKKSVLGVDSCFFESIDRIWYELLNLSKMSKPELMHLILFEELSQRRSQEELCSLHWCLLISYVFLFILF